MRLLFVWLALVIGGSGAARAEWLEASSAHFVVCADDSEKDIRTISDQIERYHAALEMVTGQKPATPSPSGRVTVYVVGSAAKVRSLYGSGGSNIGGFYIPRAGGSVAIIPRVDAAANRGLAGWSMLTLLHEYAHHFTIATSTFPVPRWMGEGGAEFFASASFDGKGGVMLGRPADHRAGELVYARDVPASDLLDPDRYEKRASASFDAFYGKSWLLYHYLVFEPSRKGQFVAYIKGLFAGKTSRAAAEAAFGDLGKLERDIESYMRKPRLNVLSIKGSDLAVGPVSVRRLGPGEAAMMPLRVRSRRGVDSEQATQLVAEARAIAQRYPGEAAVWTELAEAEHDAGNDDAAIAAADRALTIDPRQPDAYVQKGLALFRKARDSDDDARTAAYARARAPFVALNKLENDHPLPLIYYYRSFIDQGKRPPPLAVQGLARAAELAPFDLGLRMTLAMQQLRDGSPGDARRSLEPVAYNPHGGNLAEAARKVLTRLDREPAWNGAGADAAALGANDDTDGSGD
ncbi:MAG: DUF1570 domain-containing protein [Novosphingobium sp.]